jgi:hypothetical protein
MFFTISQHSRHFNLDIVDAKIFNGIFNKTSVGNLWLRHSSHPQEKEGGPKKNEK